MRDRFVGDVGDFGKYGLLRALCGARETDCGEKLRLGVVWYLNPDDNGPGKGPLDYLMNPERFRPCDPTLFHTLFWIVVTNGRSVARIADSEIFPRDSVFFDKHVPLDREKRKGWLDCALKKTRDCDLVFFDPDVGLSTAALADQRVSKKHAYYRERGDDAGIDEVGPFVDRGQSVVIWHQPALKKGAINAVSTKLRKRFGSHVVHTLTYHRVVFRAFLVISGRDHERLLAERIARFLEGPWGQPRSKRERPPFKRVPLL
jgi:hypothetical protein